MSNTTKTTTKKDEQTLEFKYSDGTSVKFEGFTGVQRNRMYIAQPKFRGKDQNTAYVYINPTDWAEVYDFAYNSRYNPAKVTQNKNKRWVGILSESLRCGIPKGSYIPYRYDYVNQRMMIDLDGLENNSILYNEAIMDAGTIAKIKAAKEEDEDDEAATSA